MFAQSLDHNADRLEAIQERLPVLSRADRLQLRDELREEVRWARREPGAIAPDHEYPRLLKSVRSYPGYYYLDKLYLEDRRFSRY